MSPAPDNCAFQDVTLALLAGGEGSRMGMPKGLLRIGEEPILGWLMDRIGWPGEMLLVTAPGRGRPPGAEGFGREVSDPEAGGGPLRGVLTALEHVRTPMVAVVTVDMPGVRGEHLCWLVEELARQPGMLGAMSCRKERAGRIVEPFPSVFRAEARGAIAKRLSDGRRSVHGLLEEPGFVAVASPEEWGESVWTNLNFPDDLARFKESAASEATGRRRDPEDTRRL